MDERIEYVLLDRALHGHLNPDELNVPTRAEYDAIAAQGPIEPGAGSPADDAADQFWAGVRECEAAVHAKGEEAGWGSEEHDQFVADLRILGGS